jgi:hypothetical protein
MSVPDGGCSGDRFSHYIQYLRVLLYYSYICTLFMNDVRSSLPPVVCRKAHVLFRMFGSSLPPVVCRKAHVLFLYVCLYVYSGVQHVLCYVVFLFLFFFVFCTLCC